MGEARLADLSSVDGLAARGESPSAFGGRCIPPPPRRGCRVEGPGPRGVAHRSHTPGILAIRAWRSGRIGRLGATTHFHHGLLGPALCYQHDAGPLSILINVGPLYRRKLVPLVGYTSPRPRPTGSRS